MLALIPRESVIDWSSMRRPTHLCRLVLLVLVLCLPARLAGAAEQVRLLESEREAAVARAEMVLGARQEILAAYFIIGKDPFTLTALALLRDAARRGVRVKLLVDDQWNKIPKAVEAHLIQEGVEIGTYHPFQIGNLHWTWRRMHDKLFVVDGEVLLAGGRNIESAYFGLGPTQSGRRNYLDCDVQVRGAVAAEARTYFLSLWASHHVEKQRTRRGPAAETRAAQLLDGFQDWIDARIGQELASSAPLLAEPIPVEGVRFIHDAVGHKRSGGVARELFLLMDAARESLIIESPYLVPSDALREVLRRAQARGVHVRILTNSLSATDNLWPQAGYVGHKKWLVATGVELWEYRGPECLHTKAAVIDGKQAVIGSYNLDTLSERLNSEIVLAIDSPAVAERLRRSMDTHLERAWRIDARGYPEGFDEPYPGITGWKRFKLRLLRLLAPFIEGML